MKKIIILLIGACFMVSCRHESLEDRAAREAKEYTEKYCPTPIENYTRTDSIVFDKNTRTYYYFCTLTDKMDDSAIITAKAKSIRTALATGIAKDTKTKAYKDAGFNFAYVLHSQKRPQQILFQALFTPKDYDYKVNSHK
jgi:ADP-ribose pyrophosphatase YjhB (NUDIX family)